MVGQIGNKCSEEALEDGSIDGREDEGKFIGWNSVA
jgi:hypothetical protein